MLAELISQDIQNVIILAMTPVVIALIPYVFKGRRDAKKRTEAVESAAETVHSTGKAQLEILTMMENSFMHIGELRGDLKEVHSEIKDLRDEFQYHVRTDEAFMDKAFGFMAKTEPTIEEIKEKVIVNNEMGNVAVLERKEIADALALKEQQP